jgi:hypothetical protein
MGRRKAKKKITARYVWFYTRSEQQQVLLLEIVLVAAIVSAASFSPAC